MTAGRSLELYFVDGKPDGMLTAEVFNWTGHVLRIPRTRLADGVRRREAGQTGVYLLLGEDADGPLAYIGEAEDMARRLGQHAKEKDWWEVAVLVTTTGDALHKAHVKYLESRLISTARAAAMRLDNGNQPSGASLNEAATANMESFLETLHMVLPAIRVDLFQTGRRRIETNEVPSSREPSEIRFEMALPRVGVHARSVLRDGELVVQAGSTARADWVGSKDSSYRRIFMGLFDRGIMEPHGDHAVFKENYAFGSPSEAASMISGRARNGRIAWKLPDGRSYADWEADQLEGATP